MGSNGISVFESLGENILDLEKNELRSSYQVNYNVKNNKYIPPWRDQFSDTIDVNNPKSSLTNHYEQKLEKSDKNGE